ncbi:MAG: hypothetical protein AB9873_15795 [Syntrophobacteraceae bacterium]
MKGYVVLMIGLLLWTASPASSQIIGPVDDRGGLDQIIRIGNRPAAQPQGVQGATAVADDSVNVDANPSPAGALAADDTLSFGGMAGVSGALVGTDLIRGVPAGGRPWQIARGEGRLSRDGTLRITVEGLVLVETGINPAVAFRGLVSCFTADGGIANVPTAEFTANPAGDAQIEDRIELPFPCFAPIVFVTGPTGNWFATTGG